MLDSNAIETIAISAICESVVRSPRLDEHINKKDKEPSVDGFVNLFKPGGKTKANFYGRVAVQVKGSLRSIPQKTNEVTFGVKISDLNFYQKESGVIFFFVWISKDGKQRRIFYNELLPVKIYKILSNMRGQSKKSLKFKELTDINNIERLFFAFYDEQKHQKHNLVDLPHLPSIDELHKQNVLSNLTLSVLNIEGYHDPVQAFLNNDVYLYADIKGDPFPVPVGLIDYTAEKAVVQEIHNSISAGNVVYEKIKRIETLTETIINIEDWFIVTFPKILNKLRKQANLKFTLRTTLKERVKDTEFLIAFFDTGGFYLGKSFFDLHVNINSINENKFSMEIIKKQLIFMKKAIMLFEILHIDENLDMAVLSENELRELDTLIRAFVDRGPINYLKDNLPYYYVKIGTIILALYHYEKDGNKYIGDIFSTNVTLSFDTDDKRHFVPAYAMLDKEGWSRIVNIDFSSVLSAFKRFYEQNSDSAIFKLANNTLLSILLAFDQTQKRQLLELAIDLSKWIFDEAPSKELGKEISLINYLQAVARNQRIEKSASQRLIEITENMNVEECIRIGAYLLLKNQIAAEVHFCKLDEEAQRAFKGWPIYRFWSAE